MDLKTGRVAMCIKDSSCYAVQSRGQVTWVHEYAIELIARVTEASSSSNRNGLVK